jgi:hypothetical protein
VRHAIGRYLPYTVTVMIEGFLLDYVASFGRNLASGARDVAAVLDPEDEPKSGLLSASAGAAWGMNNTLQTSLDMWAAIDGALVAGFGLPSRACAAGLAACLLPAFLMGARHPVAQATCCCTPSCPRCSSATR